MMGIRSTQGNSNKIILELKQNFLEKKKNQDVSTSIASQNIKKIDNKPTIDSLNPIKQGVSKNSKNHSVMANLVNSSVNNCCIPEESGEGKYNRVDKSTCIRELIYMSPDQLLYTTSQSTGAPVAPTRIESNHQQTFNVNKLLPSTPTTYKKVKNKSQIESILQKDTSLANASKEFKRLEEETLKLVETRHIRYIASKKFFNKIQ